MRTPRSCPLCRRTATALGRGGGGAVRGDGPWIRSNPRAARARILDEIRAARICSSSCAPGACLVERTGAGPPRCRPPQHPYPAPLPYAGAPARPENDEGPRVQKRSRRQPASARSTVPSTSSRATRRPTAGASVTAEVHHRQVEAGQVGDRADDRLAVGRPSPGSSAG